jgi:hypothetical protein
VALLAVLSFCAAGNESRNNASSATARHQTPKNQTEFLQEDQKIEGEWPDASVPFLPGEMGDLIL